MLHCRSGRRRTRAGARDLGRRRAGALTRTPNRGCHRRAMPWRWWRCGMVAAEEVEHDAAAGSGHHSARLMATLQTSGERASSVR
jgi:hypothetical protein